MADYFNHELSFFGSGITARETAAATTTQQPSHERHYINEYDSTIDAANINGYGFGCCDDGEDRDAELQLRTGDTTETPSAASKILEVIRSVWTFLVSLFSWVYRNIVAGISKMRGA